MKIVNSESGQAYHLKPGTQLEVERTNLFFNEWGEQTLPVELPDTDLNRQLTGYADMGTNKKKVMKNIPCTIEEGEYFMKCRQAILGAKRKESITTAFYMNEGSFLSKVENLSLKEMFGNETISGINSVSEGIAFCRNLMENKHENYACFPAIVDFEGERRYINRMEFMDASGSYYIQSRPGGITPPTGYKLGLYNAYERIETADGNQLRLSPGYYITPFIRASYLLHRIFEYFGYSLTPSLFTQEEPFKNMVFVNNTMDALVNGTVLMAHIVPDCMCGTILEVIRKKFNCEFVPDETSRKVSIKFFNEILERKATIDLSSCLTDQLDFDFSTSWKRLKILSESTVDDGPSFDGLTDVIEKFPETFVFNKDGAYYHIGYGVSSYREKVAGSTIPYSAGGTLEEKEITVPDCAISMQREPEGASGIQIPGQESTVNRFRASCYLPYLGEAYSLNSRVVIGSTESTDADVEIVSKAKMQDPALSFVYINEYGFAYGTTTQCDTLGNRIFNYSLHYNGEFGIYEKFYRKMDELYRNSLLPVRATFLLTNSQKLSIAAHEKLVVNGQEFLINKLKYGLGGKNEPVESDLLTVQLYIPISSAPLEVDRFPKSLYRWEVEVTRRQITDAEYNALSIKNSALPLIYPFPPTEAQFHSGSKFYTRVYYSKPKSFYLECTVSLIPKLNS